MSRNQLKIDDRICIESSSMLEGHLKKRKILSLNFSWKCSDSGPGCCWIRCRDQRAMAQVTVSASSFTVLNKADRASSLLKHNAFASPLVVSLPNVGKYRHRYPSIVVAVSPTRPPQPRPPSPRMEASSETRRPSKALNPRSLYRPPSRDSPPSEP